MKIALINKYLVQYFEEIKRSFAYTNLVRKPTQADHPEQGKSSEQKEVARIANKAVCQ